MICLPPARVFCIFFAGWYSKEDGCECVEYDVGSTDAGRVSSKVGHTLLPPRLLVSTVAFDLLRPTHGWRLIIRERFDVRRRHLTEGRRKQLKRLRFEMHSS